MNAPAKRVAIAVLLLFAALLINANVVQVGQASSLKKNPHNARVLVSEYSRQRGPIVVDGQGIAKSIKTDDALKYQRVYSNGPLLAHVTGYYSLVYGTAGVEQAMNDVLAGTDDRLFVRRLTDMITGKETQGGAVVLTINQHAQQVAAQALGGRKGAVVAIDPKTGAILALVSSPTYDPNRLSTHDTAQIRAYWKQLQADPDDPMFNRAVNATYPPGSTFKIITTAAALSSGKFSAGSQLPAPDKLDLPQTDKTLQNFEGETCGAGGRITLQDALRISCNTAFGALGLQLGGDRLREQAKAFGVGDGYDIPFPTAKSHFPDNPSPPEVAYSAIGQFDVRMTPLQVAMVSAAIANGGELMRPYLVKEVQGPDLSTLSTTEPHRLGRAVSAGVADTVKRFMELVVSAGTGTAAQVPGVAVAGKTGTAEHGDGSQPTHAWFTGFAPADDPQVAVAVVVENGGVGGRTAAPIAREVIQAVLGR